MTDLDHEAWVESVKRHAEDLITVIRSNAKVEYYRLDGAEDLVREAVLSATEPAK